MTDIEIRRWEAEQAGAPLSFGSAALAPPAPGEVRVRMSACALNFADTLMLEGRYQERPPLPIVPGMELSGTVEALGEGVDHLLPGARVAVHAGYGGLSEALNVAASSCVEVPEGIDMETAAAFQIVYGTAHLALSRRAALRPGERLVVTGAAGGTGLAAVQIGALMGAEVIAVARGADKLKIARDAGAAHGIDAECADLRARIKALGGADIVVDTVGAPLWEEVYRAANPEGRLFPIGFAGGKVPELRANHLLVKNLSVMGFYWGGYLKFAPDALARSLAEVLNWIADGRLTVRIGARFPLMQADAALDLIRSRGAKGKVVVMGTDSAPGA